MKRIFLVLSLLLLSASAAFANNLKIQNVSLEKRAVSGAVALVQFDVSWDNSWRHTENYDAVWLVFKASIAGGKYTQCTVANDSSGYTLGNSTGSNADMEYVYPSDSEGVFLQRKVSGYGTVATTDAQMTISCGAGAAQTIAVKIVGIEMVYIPQSPFYAGDGMSEASLRKYATNVDPWFIESESTITTTATAAGSYWYSSDGETGEDTAGSVFDIRLETPKGYQAFYCMKYPVSEGQYVDFFNSLALAEKATRDISAADGKASDSVIKRNTFSYTGSGSASTTRDDRAMSYLSWPDLAAYLDWVALRPMTELEYEKVARGPLAAVPGEYAWGSSSLPQAGITFAGSPEDGTETFTSGNAANVNYNSTTFSHGDQYLGTQYRQGPVRVGVFATSTSTRERAGAGYYGVMDLAGNLTEWVVGIGTTYGRYFYPAHGDGTLNTESPYEGNARQLGWPGVGVGIYGVVGDGGMGFKGGYWSSTSTKLRTSDRSDANYSSGSNVRDNYLGGRGVRSITLYTFTCNNDNVIKWPEQCDDANEVKGDGCDMCECESDLCP